MVCTLDSKFMHSRSKPCYTNSHSASLCKGLTLGIGFLIVHNSKKQMRGMGGGTLDGLPTHPGRVEVQFLIRSCNLNKCIALSQMSHVPPTNWLKTGFNNLRLLTNILIWNFLTRMSSILHCNENGWSAYEKRSLKCLSQICRKIRDFFLWAFLSSAIHVASSNKYIQFLDAKHYCFKLPNESVSVQAT